jgi:hypothetical protein
LKVEAYGHLLSRDINSLKQVGKTFGMEVADLLIPLLFFHQPMAHADHTRDPWYAHLNYEHKQVSDTFHSPWVILNDFGGAFAMGGVGGAIWYGIKGARNSPRVRTLL